MSLTKKQQKFCEEYLIDLNATQACIRAGYSAKRASEIGYQLLQKTTVQNFIQKLQIKTRERSEITKERILKELKIIIDAKITDYLSFDGKKITFKSFDELTDEQVRAIEGIKHTRYGIEIKLHGKNWTIERLCRMLGYDSPEKLKSELTIIWEEKRNGTNEKAN